MILGNSFKDALTNGEHIGLIAGSVAAVVCVAVIADIACASAPSFIPDCLVAWISSRCVDISVAGMVSKGTPVIAGDVTVFVCTGRTSANAVAVAGEAASLRTGAHPAVQHPNINKIKHSAGRRRLLPHKNT